uniref:Inositol polyphosphate 5-phosphatase K n=1 Tax=Mus musculus TaxID=10090 RepID=D6RI67_MOUSE
MQHGDRNTPGYREGIMSAVSLRRPSAPKGFALSPHCRPQ